MKIRLGQTDDNQEVSLDIKKFFKQRLLLQGISGSWKSATVDNLMRLLKLNMTQDIIKDIADDLKLEYTIGETDSIPQIILDWEGERIDMYRNFGNYIVLSNTEDESNNIDVENASIWGEDVRKNQSSVIIDLSSFKSIEERETIVSKFISEIIDADRQYWKPCIVLIDEGHNLCKQTGQCRSKDAIIRLCETGRKRGLATIIVTQRLTQLNKNASAQLANRIIGKTIELPDRESATKMIQIPLSRGKELADLKGGEFFAFGDAISNDTVKFKVDKKTLDELRGIVKSTEEIAEEWYLKGEIFEKDKNYSKALDCYKKATEKNPDDGHNWYWRGNMESKLENYSKALDCYKKATEKNPDNGHNWTRRGNMEEKLGNYSKALDCYKKATEKNPDNWGNWYWRGNMESKLENYSKALDCYKKATEKNPDLGYNWANKGLCENKIGEHNEALRSFDKSLEVFSKELNENPNSNYKVQLERDFQKITEIRDHLEKNMNKTQENEVNQDMIDVSYIDEPYTDESHTDESYIDRNWLERQLDSQESHIKIRDESLKTGLKYELNEELEKDYEDSEENSEEGT